MSTDTKYQVMGELLGIHAAAIEKAEEQAGRIIEMVKGQTDLYNWREHEHDPDSQQEFRYHPHEEPASLKVHPTEFTPEDLSCLKDRGHTWAEIAAESGISHDAARKRVEKWRKKQKEFYVTSKDNPKNDIEPISDEDLPPLKALIKKIEPMLYEPGAEEARQEAEAAEATIRKSQTVEEFIQERIASGDMDYEILQVVKRKLPGVSMTVADIRSRRQVA